MIPKLETLEILHTQFSAAFKAGLGRKVEPWDLIATRIPSSTSINTYAWLGDMPQMREWLGDRVIKGLSGKAYTLENKSYELTIGVPREAIEDDSFGIYMPVAEQMGFKAASHPARLVFAALKNGTTNLCYDGQPFFSSSHPVGGSTDSNDLGGGGTAWYLLDTTQVLKPIIFQERKAPELVAQTDLNSDNVFYQKKFVWGVDSRCAAGYGFWQTAVRSAQTLNETNLASAVQAMREMTDDEGEVLDLSPNLVVVPPSLEVTARKLLEQMALANGESNIMRGAYRLHVSNYVV